MKDFATIPNTSGEFPEVVARNATGPGTTDGTPITEGVINDIWGFFQALLNEAGGTPSGDCEEDGASQLLDAIETVINTQLGRVSSRNFKFVNSADGGDVLRSICFGLDNVIAVGDEAESLQTALAADAFTARTNPKSDDLKDVWASDTHAVAVGGSVGNGDALIYTTTPTGSWTDGSANIGSSGILQSVCYGDGYWVVCDDDGYIYYSTSATGAFTQVVTPASTAGKALYRVRYIEALELWIACGTRENGGFTGVITASDPTGTWTAITNPTTFANDIYRHITFDGQYINICGGGDDSNLLRSEDGSSFSDGASLLPGSDNVSAIASDLYGNTVVCIGTELYATADRCATWRGVENPDGLSFKYGIFAGGRFMFVGSNDVARSLAL